MDWARDKAIWPNSAHSRFVDVRPHRWHVQEAGKGPTVLLLHGAGGATQSWRGLFPLLAERYHVVAPDLPGQGFTRIGRRLRCGLGPMAEDVAALCRHEGWAPDAIIGHSAGAVLALELTRHLAPRAIVGLNAALGKFEGVAGWLFPLMAKFMAVNPVIPPLLARMAGGENRARELLASTGSAIDDEGVALYHRLMTDSGHIDGTLTMMAQWKIDGLLARLPGIETPTLLIAGARDETVPPKTSERAAARLPHGTYRCLDGLGHLAHEEAPALIFDEITHFLDPILEGRSAATPALYGS
ncbi:alpha/beta fold hydrolase BchO [Ovoidimarina sediminis]|uniref:alpha/beta fold hydrolase BchO n=1 Tax=Ovoidimarina sediminis TaxID=3079856 RepID=UPI00290DE44E|nr:alpha/beta fold hydrolase BchO [Rhodophyticola sp. MJ-SS7]MDU8942439.1 alpha/beta fold hydrolase [Rhodophyticola sp. MJ-SS7]